MATIQNGTAYNVGTKFWEIQDNSQAVITEFNHNRFPHILSGAKVYFMDLDLDPRLCENVQVATEVDGFISAATTGAGIKADAEEVLRDYVMNALLHALGKQGTARTQYLAQLRTKMNDIHSGADMEESCVTLAVLAAYGIG